MSPTPTLSGGLSLVHCHPKAIVKQMWPWRAVGRGRGEKTLVTAFLPQLLEWMAHMTHHREGADSQTFSPERPAHSNISNNSKQNKSKKTWGT